jgi:zinc protease
MMGVLVWLFPLPASAYLDLAAARLEHLDNGLTLIVLEDHTLPVVSVQMLYRVGARNETSGATGLAHFLEHMAFRSAQNFPDTQLAGSIYAVGGEWHGYTWLDQTTYFATAPRQQLDLLLRIESDRMARLEIQKTDVLAERGAVLAEMHGYENDPMSVLHDHVLYLVFLAHPYRNNTIGWESDVTQIGRAELVDFYRQHYQPGNAVLAVVGDVHTDQVNQQVRHYFGRLPGKHTTPAPHTVEPEQTGERRIHLHGGLERKYFKVAYRAPAATHPDYAAFLLAQELLGGGSGVSFLQNDWGTPVRADAALAGISGDLTTWFPPSAQDYVFTIGGSAPAGANESQIESAVATGISDLRRKLAANASPMAAELEQAKRSVLRALVFDVQTTEDAAHQLAFFTGLDALDVLLGLPHTVEQISTEDIGRVMDHYLQSAKRTIGWYVPQDTAQEQIIRPGPAGTTTARTQGAADEVTAGIHTSHGQTAATTAVAVSHEAVAPAEITHLGNGTPVIMQRSSLSATVSLKVVTPAAAFPPAVPARPDQPVWGVTSLDFALLPEELSTAISQARAALKSAVPLLTTTEPDPGDPAAMLERYFQEVLGLSAAHAESTGAPLLLLVSGDIDPERVLQQLETGFGDLRPATLKAPDAVEGRQLMAIESTLTRAVAQEQLGYVVRAPGPEKTAATAWQIALYILSHGYEGRLGQAAISRQGLIYYIDSAYRSDGRNGWITLSMGVDADKLPAMKELLQQELRRLVREPPSQQEIDEARQHLLGRRISAAQSNPELTDDLARQWFWYRQIMSYDELEKRLNDIRREDILELLPAFIAGSTIAIRSPRSEKVRSENARQ